MARQRRAPAPRPGGDAKRPAAASAAAGHRADVDAVVLEARDAGEEDDPVVGQCSSVLDGGGGGGAIWGEGGRARSRALAITATAAAAVRSRLLLETAGALSRQGSAPGGRVAVAGEAGGREGAHMQRTKSQT